MKATSTERTLTPLPLAFPNHRTEIDAVLIKVAAIGLAPNRDLNVSIADHQDRLCCTGDVCMCVCVCVCVCVCMCVGNGQGRK